MSLGLLTRKWLQKVILFFVSIALVIVFFAYIIVSTASAPAPAILSIPASNTQLEKVSFLTNEGLTIHGWYGEGEVGKGAVLLIHGIRGNRMQMYKRSQFLMKNGFSVLLFDLHGHGESDGDRITFGYKEAKSADAAFAFLRGRLPSEKIAVIGVSLGGAACLLGEIPFRADAIVIEEVFATIEEAVTNRMLMRVGYAGRFVAPLLLHQLPLRFGITTEQLRPEEAVKKVKCPIFVIGGSKDRRTPASETRRIFDAAQVPRELWLVKDARHVDLCDYAGPEYERRILAFFSKYLHGNFLFIS